MGKRSRKKYGRPRNAGNSTRPARPAEGGDASGSAHLRRAEELLVKGETRRAQEILRRLYLKQPSATCRERLIEVTLTQISKCLATGDLKEAGRLVGQLEAAGLAAEALPVHKLAIASGLGDWNAAAQAAAGFAESENEQLRARAGDALVLAGAPAAGPVHAAITLLCRREWDGMLQELQAIPRNSPFAHWRLFLRGCAAFWQGQREAAAQCFARLPEGTVPARKARAIQLGDPTASAASDDQALADACLLAGEPDVAAALPAVLRYWEEGRCRAAYEAAKQTGAFPAFSVSFAGQLTQFFRFAHLAMDDRKRHLWIDALIHLQMPHGWVTTAEGLLITGILAGLLDNSPLSALGDELWTRFFVARNKWLGNSPRFYALCHFSRALAHQPCLCGFCSPGEETFRRCILYLERSAEADPTFEEAPALLLKIYRKLDRNSEANRLADEMCQRFPGSKTVLLEAGRTCVERKAYEKGLSFLRRAREIDPIDRSVQDAIREALQAAAIAHYRKKTAGHIAKARQAFGEILACIPPGAPLLHSRGATLVRWACLEEVFAGPAGSLAGEKLAESETLLPGCVRAFYRAACLAKLRRRFKLSFQFLEPAPPDACSTCEPGEALQLLQLLNQEMMAEKSLTFDVSWRARIDAWLRSAVDGLGPADRETARALWAELDEEPMVSGFKPNELTARLVKRMLRLDPADPYFLCRAWEQSSVAPSSREVEAARREAQRRGDLEALNLCDELLSELGLELARDSDRDREDNARETSPGPVSGSAGGEASPKPGPASPGRIIPFPEPSRTPGAAHPLTGTPPRPEGGRKSPPLPETLPSHTEPGPVQIELPF